MLKFNEEQQIKDIRGALALRSDVEKVVDQVWTKGFDAVYYLGIGGTYASVMQAVTYANGKSNLPIYVQHAAEYYTTGNKRLTEKSFVILSSVTGTTQEVVQAVQEIKKVVGVVQDSIETALNSSSDLLFTTSVELADRRKNGESIDVKALIGKSQLVVEQENI